MAKTNRIFQVTVYSKTYETFPDKFTVIAHDDVAAREKAIKEWHKLNGKNKHISYCTVTCTAGEAI